MDNISERLKKYLDSPEGQEAMARYAARLAFEDELTDEHIEWFAKKPLDERIALVNKVIAKYNSGVYRDRWTDRCIEPPMTLFWEYYEYAQKYGEDVYDFYYKKYHRAFVFTSGLYKTEEGFIVERMDGQGSVIVVSTISDFEEYVKKLHDKYTNKNNELLHPEIVTELS